MGRKGRKRHSNIHRNNVPAQTSVKEAKGASQSEKVLDSLEEIVYSLPLDSEILQREEEERAKARAAAIQAMEEERQRQLQEIAQQQVQRTCKS